MSEPLLALSTMPDSDRARELARQLLDERLAACVNLLPGVHSLYRWRGELHEDPEVLMIMKTTRTRFDALRKRLAELHPYEVPELIALPIVDGLSSYLEWMNQCTID